MPGPSPLCPSSAELRLEQIAFADDLITITATGRRREVGCPLCGALALSADGILYIAERSFGSGKGRLAAIALR